MAAGRHGGYKDQEFRDRDSDVEISRRRDYQQSGLRDADRDRARRRDDRDRVKVKLRDGREREMVNGSRGFNLSIGSKGSSGHNQQMSRLALRPFPVEREPGELSSGSESDDTGAAVSKTRENEALENGNSSTPSKKRRFSPIIWDRDSDSKGSGGLSSRSKNDWLETVALPPPSALQDNYFPPNSVEIAQLLVGKASPQLDVEVSVDSFQDQRVGNSDQDAGPMEEDEEEFIQQRNISFSRWADGNNGLDDDDDNDEPVEEKAVPPKNINASFTDFVRKQLQKFASTPEQGEVTFQERSGGALLNPSDSEGEHGDDYQEVDKNDQMDVDQEMSSEDRSCKLPDTDSEAEDIRLETPELKQPPQRCIDMLQGCRSVDEFERLNKIDEGTYGVVYRARDKKSGEIVALKKVKMEKEREGFPLTSLREINILLSFHHPSVVDVKEVVVGRSLDSIFMVMEYMEHDLKGLMETMKQPFSQSEVKCLMLQLFSGVKYLHDNWVLHRDLKTSNLLLNNSGELKICDFGLSRQYGSPLKPYTHLVVTLWYRAPELLLGAKEYSTAIDMWSLGCIMAELLGKEPLFSGKTELDQLDKIFRTLGTPNEKIWPGFAKLPGFRVNFVKQPYNKLREKFPATSFSGRPTLSEAGFDLLNRLLTYDPEKRISAEAALRHDWFCEVPLPKSKEFMPTFPAQHAQDRRLRRIMKSPDPLAELRKKELQQGELGLSSLFG